MGKPIRVLHVDDEQSFSELVATVLERENPRFTVETATGPSRGLEFLADNHVDCIVSDYDMPGQNGIAFLKTVREIDEDLPFILYTGKGSEEVASDAILAGVSDYLQKKAGTEQYELLANRIRNAVDKSRATERVANLDRARTLSSEVNQALVRATSRSEIESRVCEIFSASDPYLFAWIGEVDTESSRVEPQTEAGLAYEDLEELSAALKQDGADSTPARTAVRDQCVAVSQNLQADDASSQWRQQALERGCRAVAAVPLSYSKESYGVLSVCADSPGAFDEEERDLLAELGDDIAHAIHSLETQRQLQEERDRRAVLFANNINPVIEFTFENESPIIEAVNGAFEAVFGYDAEDVGGEAIADVILPEDDHETYELVKQRVLSGRSAEAEVERMTATGVREFVRRVIPYTAESSPEGGYVWFTDITEQRKRKQELQQYQTIVEALGDPVYVLDPKGNYTLVNDAFLEKFGYSRSELIGTHVSEVVSEPQYQTGQEVITGLLADDDRRSATWELERTTADGDPVPVENHVALLPTENGTFRGTAGVFRDISERKQREQRLESITEAATKEAIYIKDTAGRYRFINEVGAQLFDRNPADMLGRRAAALYEEVDADRLAVDETVIESREPIEYEVTRTVGGEQRHFLAEKRPYYENGDLFGLVGISRDITERKEYEQQLKRQNERLDEFSRIVAHDIRNPLNVAQGNLELARAECDNEHLSTVAGAHDRMGELISDLLLLARQGQTVTETEAVELAAVVEQCWYNVTTTAAELHAEADITISADRTRFQQLLENLIHNAIVHGGEKVSITVDALEDRTGFYFADDGPGIPADERETVFELGYSTAEEGTGFGLSVVSDIAEAHGWSIRATESDAGGARFEITGVDVVE
jgi:PAS domain S-box-containing protein